MILRSVIVGSSLWKNVFAICDYVWTHFFCSDVVSLVSSCLVFFLRCRGYFWVLPILSPWLLLLIRRKMRSGETTPLSASIPWTITGTLSSSITSVSIYFTFYYFLLQSLTCLPWNAHPFDCSLPDTRSPIYRKIAYCPRDSRHFAET